MLNMWVKYCVIKKLGFIILYFFEKIYLYVIMKFINMFGFKIKLLDLNLIGIKCGLD